MPAPGFLSRHCRLEHRFAWALLLTLLAYLGGTTVFRAAYSQAERTDFTVYRAAAQGVRDGGDLYAAHNTRGWGYVYAPPFALLMTPFALIPVAWGALMWFLLSLFLSGWALKMACEQGDTPDRRWPCAVLSLAVLPWFVSGITRGQASEPMVWMVVATVFWTLRGKPWRAGASLDAAILLKVFPAPLLLWLVWRRNWRALAGAAVTLTLGGLRLPGLVRGWQHNLDDLREWHTLMWQPALASNTACWNNPLYGIKQVRTQEDADVALLGQLQQQVVDLPPAAGVQSTGRLIEDQQLRPADQRTGEGKTLLHAA